MLLFCRCFVFLLFAGEGFKILVRQLCPLGDAATQEQLFASKEIPCIDPCLKKLGSVKSNIRARKLNRR